MQLPRSQEEVLRNQSDTLAADLAEARYAANIDFGGVSSTAVSLPSNFPLSSQDMHTRAPTWPDPIAFAVMIKGVPFEDVFCAF